MSKKEIRLPVKELAQPPAVPSEQQRKNWQLLVSMYETGSEAQKSGAGGLAIGVLKRLLAAAPQEGSNIADRIARLAQQHDELLAALLWVLWHHQGGSSDTGQPIRKLLGIGQHDRLTDDQLRLAKSFIASVKGGA